MIQDIRRFMRDLVSPIPQHRCKNIFLMCFSHLNLTPNYLNPSPKKFGLCRVGL